MTNAMIESNGVDEAPPVREYDVAIVGYGPVGQALVCFLGQQGHRVVAVERYGQLYDLPRAAHFDAEIMRLFQRLGVAEEVELIATPVPEVRFLDRNRQLLSALVPPVTHSGWAADYGFFQPELEAILDRAARSMPNVEVMMGHTVNELTNVPLGTADDGAVRLGVRSQAGKETELRAGFAIGADGANSFVREAAGLHYTDLGFEPVSYLVIDLEPHRADLEIRMLGSGPNQILDPRRPATAGRWLGRRYCQFQFMVMPGESRADMEQEETCWRLLEPWGLSSEEVSILRRAVYDFRGAVCEQWLSGRVMLAGDAAHLMPPFVGQGLCSGFRDAANLAWKLDLVLRGAASPNLLRNYEQERREQVTEIVERSMEVGRLCTLTDPVAERERNESLRLNPPAEETMPPLRSGKLVELGSEIDGGSVVGSIMPQGRVVAAGEAPMRLEDALVSRWHLLVRHALDESSLGDRRRAVLESIGGEVIWVTPARMPGALVDLDLVYEEWFQHHQLSAVLVRPDLYIFGAAARMQDAGSLIDALADGLDLAGSERVLQS